MIRLFIFLTFLLIVSSAPSLAMGDVHGSAEATFAVY